MNTHIVVLTDDESIARRSIKRDVMLILFICLLNLVYHVCDYCVTDARRALPGIPLMTTSTVSNQQPRPRQPALQIQSSTPFDDDGHYTDIHWNVSGGGGDDDGAARIPTQRRSLAHEAGHYNCPEFNQQTPENRTTAQRQRSSSDYQGLDPAERQPPVPHHYTGIGSDQQRSRTDPVEESEIGNHRVLEQFQRPVVSRDHNALRSQSDSVVCTSSQQHEELPQRPRSYGGVKDTSTANDQPGRHNYLEIIGYLGTNNRKTAEGYEGLDPAEVEELRRRANRPHEYAGLTGSRP